MTRILTFMALSVWLAFGLAFKLVTDAASTPAYSTNQNTSATEQELAELKRRRLEEFQKRFQDSPAPVVIEQTASLK